MKAETRDKLFESWIYCDIHDKSTEFMLQYMQDTAGVSLDCVLIFLEKTTNKEYEAWYDKRLTDKAEEILDNALKSNEP